MSKKVSANDSAKSAKRQNPQRDDYPKKEKVPTLHSSNANSFRFVVPSSESKYSPMLVMVVTQSGRAEMIVHRPIGQHDLDKDDWVLSSKEEYTQLLSRQKDPNREALERGRAEAILQVQLAKGLIEETDGVYHYTGDKALTLSAINQLVRDDKNPTLQAKATLLKRSIALEKRDLEVVNLRFTSSFRTRSGIRQERDQEALKGQKGRPQDAVFAHILRSVADTRGKSEVPLAPLTPQLQSKGKPIPDIGSVADALNKVIADRDLTKFAKSDLPDPEEDEEGEEYPEDTHEEENGKPEPNLEVERHKASTPAIQVSNSGANSRPVDKSTGTVSRNISTNRVVK
jgi:hypothetical protein